MSVVVHQTQQFVVQQKLLLVLVHQPQGSVWFFLYCCSLCPEPWLPDSPGSPPRPPRARTFLGARLQCDSIFLWVSSVFKLSSSLSLLLSRSTFAATLVRKPSLRAAASSRSRTGSMPARRECGSTGLLGLSCLRLPGLLRCLPQRGSPQAPQVAQVARRLQICSSPCHACLSCGLRYLRLPIRGLLPPHAAILFPHTAGILSVPPSSMPSSEG